MPESWYRNRSHPRLTPTLGKREPIAFPAGGKLIEQLQEGGISLTSSCLLDIRQASLKDHAVGGITERRGILMPVAAMDPVPHDHRPQRPGPFPPEFLGFCRQDGIGIAFRVGFENDRPVIGRTQQDSGNEPFRPTAPNGRNDSKSTAGADPFLPAPSLDSFKGRALIKHFPGGARDQRKEPHPHLAESRRVASCPRPQHLPGSVKIRGSIDAQAAKHGQEYRLFCRPGNHEMSQQGSAPFIGNGSGLGQSLEPGENPFVFRWRPVERGSCQETVLGESHEVFRTISERGSQDPGKVEEIRLEGEPPIGRPLPETLPPEPLVLSATFLRRSARQEGRFPGGGEQEPQPLPLEIRSPGQELFRVTRCQLAAHLRRGGLAQGGGVGNLEQGPGRIAGFEIALGFQEPP